jgi:hypothetical protein
MRNTSPSDFIKKIAHFPFLNNCLFFNTHARCAEACIASRIPANYLLNKLSAQLNSPIGWGGQHWFATMVGNDATAAI